jgi:hypothetical protein
MEPSCAAQDLVRKQLFWWMWAGTVAFIAFQELWPPSRPWPLVMVLAGWGGFCGTNAMRCGRLHCYITGPAFLIAAAWLALAGLGFLAVANHWFNALVFGALLLGVLAELAFGRYGRRAAKNP